MLSGNVGPYVILDKLGAGGMGEVYLADDPRLRRKVALKRLLDSRLTQAGARDRLLHEARAAATLAHPGIAAVFDVVEADEAAWIVMEYVPGETLRARARRGPLPAAQAIDIGIQLADALADAHAHGVIHRDLKPANVRVTGGGKVKILDFGIAKTLDPPPDQDAPTMEAAIGEAVAMLGTPGYAAPEQMLGRTADSRSDIFGLGAVLFELVTGRPPFEGCNAFDVALSSLTAPPDPSALVPGVPPALGAIVLRAMSADPRSRFGSAVEMRAALEQLHADGSANQAPLDHGRRARVPLISRWLPATIVVVALAAVASWVWRPRPAVSPETPVVAVLPLANLSGDPANDYLGSGVAETLTSDLASLPGITVVAHARAAAPPRDRREYARIARDLGAGFIVDGGVQQAAGRMKLTATLMRADGSIAWGGSYDGASGDLFAAERQLAEAIGQVLPVKPAGTGRASLPRQPTENLEAFADYAQGRAFLDRLDVAGNADRAVRLFTSATQKDPGFALAHAGLGEACWARYQETKDPEWTNKARAASLEALRLDPNQAAVRYSLAVIYRGSGDAERAMDELRRALALRPNSDDAHRMLGEILAEQGKIDAAVSEFNEAVALRPGFWGTYDALGVALYRAGRFADATAAFERVTHFQPDNAIGFQRLGTAYHAAGDTTKALVNYQRALELSPTPRAWANVGFLDYRQGRFADAADAYERALALDATSHVTLRNLGDVYRRIGKAAEARSAYHKAVEITTRMLAINPKDAETLSQRALYEAKLGAGTDAARDIDHALALAPNGGQVLYNKAIVLVLAGDYEAAQAALEQAIAHGASAPVARDDDEFEPIRKTAAFARAVASRR